jgi:hypothetical protein
MLDSRINSLMIQFRAGRRIQVPTKYVSSNEKGRLTNVRVGSAVICFDSENFGFNSGLADTTLTAQMGGPRRLNLKIKPMCVGSDKHGTRDVLDCEVMELR